MATMANYREEYDFDRIEIGCPPQFTKLIQDCCQEQKENRPNVAKVLEEIAVARIQLDSN